MAEENPPISNKSSRITAATAQKSCLNQKTVSELRRFVHVGHRQFPGSNSITENVTHPFPSPTGYTR